MTARTSEASLMLAGRELSAQERYCLQAIAFGATYKEIARHRHLSRETVKTHVRRALAKLEAHNGAHAVALAFREGLIA